VVTRVRFGACLLLRRHGNGERHAASPIQPRGSACRGPPGVRWLLRRCKIIIFHAGRPPW